MEGASTDQRVSRRVKKTSIQTRTIDVRGGQKLSNRYPALTTLSRPQRFFPPPHRTGSQSPGWRWNRALRRS